MADNYLEKRMEEHRAMQAAAKARGTGRGARPSIKFVTLRVFVADADLLGDTGREIITRYAAAGCTVAFTCRERSAGNALAQRTGGRFYPMAADEALANFGTPDVVVSVANGSIRLDFAADSRTVEIAPARPEAAQLCVLMSAPGANVCAEITVKKS